MDTAHASRKMDPISIFDWSETPLEGGRGGFGQVYKVTL